MSKSVINRHYCIVHVSSTLYTSTICVNEHRLAVSSARLKVPISALDLVYANNLLTVSSEHYSPANNSPTNIAAIVTVSSIITKSIKMNHFPHGWGRVSGFDCYPNLHRPSAYLDSPGMMYSAHTTLHICIRLTRQLAHCNRSLLERLLWQ